MGIGVGVGVCGSLVLVPLPLPLPVPVLLAGLFFFTTVDTFFEGSFDVDENEDGLKLWFELKLKLGEDVDDDGANDLIPDVFPFIKASRFTCDVISESF